MRKRRPVDSGAAESQAVDYLLREFRKLPKKAGAAGGSTSGTTATSFGMPTIYVAAYNARDEVKAVADFVCDGDADEVEINAALAMLDDWDPVSELGGVVQLSAGNFNCDDRIYQQATSTAIWLRGMGINATQIETWAEPPSEQEAFVAIYAYYSQVTDLAIWVSEEGYRSSLLIDPPSNSWGMVRNCDIYWDENLTTDLYAILDVGDNIHVYDCEIWGGNAGPANTSSGIAIATGVFGGIISGNFISGQAGANLSYGIRVSLNNTGWRLVNNTIRAVAQRGIILGPGSGHVNDCLVFGNLLEQGLELGNANVDGTRIGGNTGTITDGGAVNTVNMDNDALGAGDVSPLTTKGDLWGYDTADNRLPVGGTNGHILTEDSTQALGIKWAANVKEKDFSQPGLLTIGSGTVKYFTQTDRTITGIFAMVSGAPVTSPAIFDVNMDGSTTIFTTQSNRPTIAAAAFLSTVTVPDITAWDAGSYLLIDVDAANSATDLIVVVQYTEA